MLVCWVGSRSDVCLLLSSLCLQLNLARLATRWFLKLIKWGKRVSSQRHGGSWEERRYLSGHS